MSEKTAMQSQILAALAAGEKDEGEIRGALRIDGRRAGGFATSLHALYQKGLIGGEAETGLYTITEAGRAALSPAPPASQETTP